MPKQPFGFIFTKGAGQSPEAHKRIKDFQNNAKQQAVTGLVGGMGVGAAELFNQTRGNQDYLDPFDRQNFADSISGLDPDLKLDYVKRGGQFYNSAAKFPYEGTKFIEPDTSQRGGYLKNLRNHKNLDSIVTVTPTAASSRFGAIKESAQKAGAAASETLYGHGSQPVYSYADNNYSAGVLNTTDPSVHFSGAELLPDKKGKYLLTGGANELAAKGIRPTWGVEKDSGNIMFNSDTRRIGGLTTAADLYKYADELGLNPPAKGSVNNSTYLEDLTRKISQATGKGEFELMQELASPHPVSGNPGRVTGEVPTIKKYTLKNMTPAQAAQSGWGSLVEENTDPFNRKHIPLSYDTDTHIQLTPKAAKPPTSPYSRFVNSRGVGLAGAAATSPEAAKLLREGKVGEAAGLVGLGYGTGEAFAGVTRFATDQLVKRGLTQAPNIIAGLGSVVATPLTGVGAIDTVSTLASGKNVRELAVETGNVGPALQAMSMPRTMAPLGGAGAVSQSVGMQATVPNLYPERKKESEAGDKRVNAARKRGGRFRFAGLSLPEFGFSEGLGIN